MPCASYCLVSGNLAAWYIKSLNYIKQNRLKDTMHKRHRRADMAFQIDAMSVSPDTTTKEGVPHAFIFLICAFIFEL